MRTITLEEHFASPGFLDGPGRELREQSARPDSPVAKVFGPLCDLGEARIDAMDAAGIDVQVLSLTSPGTEQLAAAAAEPLAREANDFLAAAVRRHPRRFAGFAALPTAAPEAAAAELERTVREHGFKGAVINGHVGGRYLDDPFFWPILARAEALQVPIYLHPTPPPQPVIAASYSGFSPLVDSLLAGPGWGWHVETAVHVIRLILGGALDRHPKLQLVVGHLGETLPFMLPRLDAIFVPARTKLKRRVGAYLRENVHYTFSGFNFLPGFLDLLLQVGVDRILFSADHPYASMSEARAFLDRLPVSPADRARIAHGNAEHLLRM
jgi:predicted TIM-barrel fold metal-dependent hydrolase